MKDLELKELGQFTGTEKYYSILGANVTDGIIYLMDCGYAWLVTDALAVIKLDKRLLAQDFLCVKLQKEGDAANMLITDGNDEVLYRQHYGYTDAKREPVLYFTNNVLMLSGEY